MEQLKEVISEYAVIQERLNEITNKFGEKLSAALQDLVKTYPTVEAFKWSQYTPYFNDGDSCEFSVYTDPSIKFVGADEDAGDYEDGFIDSYALDYSWSGRKRVYKTPEDTVKGKIFEEIEAILKSIPEGVMLAAYDDHVHVIVTNDSVETEEYDHE